MRHKLDHDDYLNKLVSNLWRIGENLHEMRWIMKDGIYKPEHTLDRNMLCDLICVYKNYAVPIELKGNRDKKQKAIMQIRSGREFIVEELHLRCPYGKFVVYRDGYSFEKINFK